MEGFLLRLHYLIIQYLVLKGLFRVVGPGMGKGKGQRECQTFAKRAIGYLLAKAISQIMTRLLQDRYILRQ